MISFIRLSSHHRKLAPSFCSQVLDIIPHSPSTTSFLFFQNIFIAANVREGNISIQPLSPLTSKLVLKHAELRGLKTLFDMAFTATDEEVADLALICLTDLHTADFSLANASAMMSLSSSSVNTCLQRVQYLWHSSTDASSHTCQRVFAVLDMLIQPNIPGQRHGTNQTQTLHSVSVLFCFVFCV